LLGLLGLAFYSLLTFSSGLTTLADAPTGYDPLSAPEIEAAVAAARQAEQSGLLLPAASGAQEVLLVERHDAAKTDSAKGVWPRQADVYVYEYTSDTLIRTTVAVRDGAVLAVERVQGVQLPLSAAEEQRALALVQADAALWTRLADRYQTITAQPLHSLAQLQVKVSVFQADVLPDQLNTAAQQCGLHRCAQALIFTVDKTLLALTPIIDLSVGQVVQTLGEE
jgi:hypothetical protein